MNTNFKKYLEEEIENQINFLRPEIRKRAIFRSVIDGDEKVFASCNRSLNPALITFNINSWANEIEPKIKRNIREVLTHELIHTMQDLSQSGVEAEAYEKQNKLNFFEDDKVEAGA